MPSIENAETGITPVRPASRWLWITICLLFAMIAVSGCLTPHSATPTQESGAKPGQQGPAGPAAPANSGLNGGQGGGPSRSASMPATAHPPLDTLSESPPASNTTPAQNLPLPVVGGADKIAYLYKNEVWVSNLDGSEQIRLSRDGLRRSGLQWSPDGQSVTYRGDDRCLYRLGLVDRIPEKRVCFPFAQYFRAFEISPDGAQVALSIDNWLYLLPNDLDLLNTVKSHADLSEKASCHYFDPLEKDPDHRIVAKYTRWSQAGDRLAFVTHSADRQVGDVSIVRVMTYNGCRSIPQALNYFPAWHLLPEAYRRFPTLASFAWDGKDRFAFVAALDRETGLGGLFHYDTGSWKLAGPIDWGSDCCYRDPVFSPDGSLLLFAHQAEPPDGSIRLYLAPVGEDDDPSEWIPLPLPEMNPFTRPEAVLRPALPSPVP